MNAYRIAKYPTSSIASGVTLLVSAWFLVASGAILAGPAPSAPAVQAAAPTHVAIAPEARLTITVEASRSASL